MEQQVGRRKWQVAYTGPARAGVPCAARRPACVTTPKPNPVPAGALRRYGLPRRQHSCIHDRSLPARDPRSLPHPAF